MTMRIDLPWPHRDLSPNARKHWGAKSRATKTARAFAGYAAWEAGVRKLDADRLNVTLLFSPPSARVDTDNAIAACKAYFDGVADVVGVDDSKWTLTIRRLTPCKPGSVRIEIEVPE